MEFRNRDKDRKKVRINHQESVNFPTIMIEPSQLGSTKKIGLNMTRAKSKPIGIIKNLDSKIKESKE